MAKTIISFEAKPGADYLEKSHGDKWRDHYLAVLAQSLPKVSLSIAKQVAEALTAAADLHAPKQGVSAKVVTSLEIDLGHPELVTVRKPVVAGAVRGLRQIDGDLKLKKIELADIEHDVGSEALFSEAEMQGILRNTEDFEPEGNEPEPTNPPADPPEPINLPGIILGEEYVVNGGENDGARGVYIGGGRFQSANGDEFVIEDASLLESSKVEPIGEEETGEEPEPEEPTGEEPEPGYDAEPEKEEEETSSAPTAKEEQEAQERGLAVDRHGVKITLDEWEELSERDRGLANGWLKKKDADEKPRMNRVIKKFMTEAATG